MPRDDRPTVYSTEWDDDPKSKPKKTKPQTKSLPPNQQTIYLRRSTKGRGGKTVSLVEGLQLNEKDLKALSKTLKKTCGTGGTIKDGVIEIQGEHREKIAAKMQKMGYKVKIAGG
jgi:translation initiation factor 1